LEERLKATNLTTDERAKLQGALASWNVWEITTFQPMSSVLFAAGIMIMVYAVVSGIFTVTQSYRVVKKAESEP
jgi:hypothetical protein